GLRDRLWLRQLATDDTPDVGDRFGDVIFEADRTPHARHSQVNEAIETILQQVDSFRSVLDRERKEQPSLDLFEFPVILHVGSENAADIVINGADDADAYLRPGDLASEETARHESKSVLRFTHVPRFATLFVRVLDGKRKKMQRRAAYRFIRN